MVLVQAGPVPKGRLPYHGLLMVTHVLGRYTFELSDGQQWCTRWMKHWYNDPALLTTLEPMDEPLQVPMQEVPLKKVAEKPWKTTSATAGKPPDHFKP